jgi:tRNA/rRNA methyltransferase
MRGIRIVLVETLGALNLGAVARVMQNMGLKDLVLVNPQCRLDDPEAEKMAVHAQDILVGARVVPDLLSALQDCDRILATVGRRERGDRPVLSLEEGCRWLAERGSQPAIVFGREDRGLSNWELRYFPAVLTIDTDPQAPSLNLAQAVAIFCYQWRSQQRSHPTPPLPREPLATTEELEAGFADLQELLLQIGFLYPHTAFARMQKLRHIFQRCQLSASEVNMLRGILHQMRWSLSNGVVQRERTGI